MSSSPPEQFLEWTFETRRYGMEIVQILLGFLFLFGPPLVLWLLFPSDTLPLVIILSALALLFLLFMRFSFDLKPTSQTLRVDRQTITLTDNRGWWKKIKERRMSVNGAKFHAVHFSFLERIFTFDLCRTDSAFHVQFTRSGEAFRFPCFDEREQMQIIEKIKTFLSQKEETGTQEAKPPVPERRTGSESCLKWTYERRLGGTHLFLTLRETLSYLIIIIPLLMLVRWRLGRGNGDFFEFFRPMNSFDTIFFIVVLTSVATMLLFNLVITLLASRGSFSRTLRVDRQVITLTDTTVWRTNFERRMHTDGATFSAAHLDFFEHVFTFDKYKPDSDCHVKITRNDQTFLFPCRDGKEQWQIIKQMKEFLAQ